MPLDGKIPAVEPPENLGRHPPAGPFHVLGGVGEHESFTGLHEHVELPQRFGIRMFIRLDRPFFSPRPGTRPPLRSRGTTSAMADSNMACSSAWVSGREASLGRRTSGRRIAFRARSRSRHAKGLFSTDAGRGFMAPPAIVLRRLRYAVSPPVRTHNGAANISGRGSPAPHLADTGNNRPRSARGQRPGARARCGK